MNSGVYRIKNLVDGKIYIGSSQNLKKRWRDHLWDFGRGQHCNPLLQAAWNKYGESSFVFEILEEVTPEKLVEREQFYLDQIFNLVEHYNICPVAFSKLGVPCQDETRKKIGNANKGKVRSEEVRAKISKGHKGKKFTEEHRAKLSAALKGRIITEAARAKLRAKVVSPESKARMSANHKTRKKDQHHV